MIVKMCEMKLVQAPNNQLINNYALCLAGANALLRNTFPVVLSTKGEELDFYDYLKAVETSSVLVTPSPDTAGLPSAGGTRPHPQALGRSLGPRVVAQDLDPAAGPVRGGRGGHRTGNLAAAGL